MHLEVYSVNFKLPTLLERFDVLPENGRIKSKSLSVSLSINPLPSEMKIFRLICRQSFVSARGGVDQLHCKLGVGVGREGALRNLRCNSRI